MEHKEGKIAVGAEAATSLLLMAAVPSCIKFVSANTFTLGIFRLSVAVLLILIFLRPFKTARPVDRKTIMVLMMIGGAFALHWITYFLGIKKATASIGILGASTYGIHLIFLGWIFRNNKPGIFDMLALMIAITGTYLVVPEFSLSNDMTIGLLLAIFSGFCFALLPILHQKNQYIPDNQRTFGQFFFAWVIFLFFLPLTHWHLPKVDWWALAYLAVPGTFITHWLWIRVTTRISTTITSIIFYLVIPLTMLVSHLWLKEPMPVQKIVGAVLIVSGNLLSFYGRRRG